MNKEFYENHILSNPFELTLDIIIHQCRTMDKEDIYGWVYEDELKIKRLQEENIKLKEKLHKIDDIVEDPHSSEYVKWFDKEYCSIYGELCECAGAKGNRLAVVELSDIQKIIKGDSNE